jgi:hypothetical protein
MFDEYWQDKKNGVHGQGKCKKHELFPGGMRKLP